MGEALRKIGVGKTIKILSLSMYVCMYAWILEREMDWKRPCKLLCRPFYGHLCTFFGLSVAARSTLSHLSVEL